MSDTDEDFVDHARERHRQREGVLLRPTTETHHGRHHEDNKSSYDDEHTHAHTHMGLSRLLCIHHTSSAGDAGASLPAPTEDSATFGRLAIWILEW